MAPNRITNEYTVLTKLFMLIVCLIYAVHTLYEYAEVEMSCAPNCVGLEGLSESSVTNPVLDSSYAHSLAGLFLGA